MTMKKKLLLAAGLATVCAGLALATPTIGALVNNVLSLGTAEHDLHVFARVPLPGGDDRHRWHEHEHAFRAALETDGPSNIIIHEVTLQPGGTTGWHTHPGIVMLTLAPDSGPIEWYDADCHKTSYQANDAWTEGTRLHDVVVGSGKSAHFFLAYVVAKDVPKRTDQPQPECGLTLGLN